MLIQRVYIKVQTTGYTQKQESQIRLCQKTCKKKKRLDRSANEIFGSLETMMSFYQNDGKRKVRGRRDAARDLKRTTLCVKHDGANVMAWACLAAS